MKIDINFDDLDIYIEGQLVLHIGQVSDKETINLFLYPSKGALITKSLMSEEYPGNECTHEILMIRRLSNDKRRDK